MLVIVWVCLSFLLSVSAWAEEGDYLYIVTRPMGATVYLDGQAFERTSPLLLRNVEAGIHRIRVEKDGWYAQDARIDVAMERSAQFSLVPRNPLAYIDAASMEGTGGAETKTAPSATVRFSSEALILQPGERGMVVTPVFPKQRLLDGVKMSLPLFLALTGVLTVREIYAPRESDFVLAPELAASSLLGGGMFVWNILLESERDRFLKNHRIQSASWEDLSLAARLGFEAAKEALAGGNFDVALARFTDLTTDYPDDLVMPYALFETGRILFIKGDFEGSAEVYRTIAERYPLPDLHDRSRKALADCLIEMGDTAGALEQLDLLSFNGSGLTREEVDLYRDLF